MNKVLSVVQNTVFLAKSLFTFPCRSNGAQSVEGQQEPESPVLRIRHIAQNVGEDILKAEFMNELM